MPSSPAIDASGAGTGIFSTTSSGTASLTTTTANDLAVCVVAFENSAAQRNVSSVTAAGLTFTKYVQQAIGDSFHSTQEIWTAQISGTVSAETITVNLDGAIDDATIAVFGVTGLFSAAAPWDPNASLPVLNTIISPTKSATISTTNPDDLLLWVISSRGHGFIFQPSGFTTVASRVNGGGIQFSELLVAVLSVSSRQASATYSVTAGVGLAGGQPLLMSAFTADSPFVPPGSKIRRRRMDDARVADGHEDARALRRRFSPPVTHDDDMVVEFLF